MLQNFETVFISGLVLLIFMISNWVLGTYDNVGKKGHEFEWTKFKNGLIKFLIVLLGVSLFVIGTTIATEKLSSDVVDFTIINILVLIALFGGASTYYAYETLKHLQSILDVGNEQITVDKIVEAIRNTEEEENSEVVKPDKPTKEKVIRPIPGIYGPYKEGNPDGIDFYVTSPYGDRTLKGVTKLHNGTDYGTYQKNLDVVAIYDAEIIAVGNDTETGAGNYIKYRFKLDEQYYVVSSFHLNSYNVSKGDIVKQGETIGTVGKTGNSSGIHLHHEIHKGYEYNRKNSFDFAELLFA